MSTQNALNAAEVALGLAREQLDREPRFINQQVALIRIKQARIALDRLYSSVENLEYLSTEPDESAFHHSFQEEIESIVMPDSVQEEVNATLREIRVEKHVEKTFSVPAFNFSGVNK